MWENKGSVDKKNNAKKKLSFRTVTVNLIIAVMLIGLSALSFSASNPMFAISKKNSAPYYKGNTARSEVSLMINVYWGTEYLDSMLKTLKKYNATCTFFVGGTWADKNNELLKRIIDEGHEIGNHGYFHKDQKKLSYQKNFEEISMNNAVVKAITGYDMKLFAPPSGSFGNKTLSAANDLDMTVIMWSKDTIDWRDKDSSLVYNRATNKVESGDLILMHPTEHTASALPNILKYYQKIGLHAVTVSQNISNATI